MQKKQIYFYLSLCHLVAITVQQCLDTTRIKGSDYSFALASVNDPSNPLGPQEACYYSCGAQVVTHSANKGGMARLTLMDNAAPVLTAAGFLQVGKVYLLNHLGLTEEEGGNGIGCIGVERGNKLRHYPRNHALCSTAKLAVCGYWGEQKIPLQTPQNLIPTQMSPAQTSSPTSSSLVRPTANPPTRAKPTRRPRPKTTLSSFSATKTSSTTTVTITSQTSYAETTSILDTTMTTTTTLGAIETISDAIVSIVNQTLIEGVVLIDPDIVTQFDINNFTYSVISSNSNNSIDASLVCQKKNTKISDMTSADYDEVSVKLQTTIASGSKLIISSWNNHSYPFSGDNCLILQVNYGIYPGSCSESTAVLCQS